VAPTLTAVAVGAEWERAELSLLKTAKAPEIVGIDDVDDVLQFGALVQRLDIFLTK
jgi:hypothetical protein